MCIGDFNELLHNSEKCGRCQQPNWKLKGFRAAVSDSGLVDLGMKGYQYTWERSRGTVDWVEKRLDRALASSTWLSFFPKARVVSLEAMCSDHLPIFLDPFSHHPYPRIKRFKFENVWPRESDCVEVVTKSWERSGGRPIQSKLLFSGADLMRWGGHVACEFINRLASCK